MINRYLLIVGTFLTCTILFLPLSSVTADTAGVSEQDLLDKQAQEIICLSLVPFGEFVNHMGSSEHALAGSDAVKNAVYDCGVNPEKAIANIQESGAAYFFREDVERSFFGDSSEEDGFLSPGDGTEYVALFGGNDDNPFSGDNNPFGGDNNAGGDEDCECTPPDIDPAKAALEAAKKKLADAEKTLKDAHDAYKAAPTPANFLKGVKAQVARDKAKLDVLSAEHDVKIIQAQIDVCGGDDE